MRSETCKCSHDKATHFDEKHACLGMLCDCSAYVDQNTPDPPAVRPEPRTNDNKPHADYACPCDACQAWKRKAFYPW